MTRFNDPAVILPIPLRVTVEEHDLFTGFARDVRRVHLATQFLMLGTLLDVPLTMKACWEAAGLGILPPGLTPPDPEASFLIPESGPGLFPEPGALSSLMADFTRSLLLPSFSVNGVIRALYRKFAEPTKNSELGLRCFSRVMSLPTVMDPLVIPLHDVTSPSPLKLSIPLSNETRHIVQAATFQLPSFHPLPSHAFRAELQFHEGTWVIWAQIPLNGEMPAPTGDLVGVDPGMNQWLTCVDAFGTFHLPAPLGTLAPKETPLEEAAIAFEQMREGLEEVTLRLLSYRRIAFENLNPDHIRRMNNPKAREFFRATGIGVLREWLSALAFAYGDREVRFTSNHLTSDRCPRCKGWGWTQGKELTCRSCGYTTLRDGASAQIHAQRFSQGNVIRQNVFKYMPPPPRALD